MDFAPACYHPFMDNPFMGGPESEPVASAVAVRSDQGGQDSAYNRIVRIVAYAAILAVPLLYLPFTSSVVELNKQLALIVLAGVAFVVWLLGVVVSGTMTVRFSPVDKGILALAAASGITTLTSLTPGKSLLGINISLSDAFVSVAALAVLYWVIVNVFHDRGRLARRLLILGGSAALILGVMQMLTVYVLPGSFTHSRAFNTVGSLNALGVLAAVLVPLFAKSTSRLWGRYGVALGWIGVAVSLFVLTILNWWVLWGIALAGMLAMIGFDSINSVQMSADYGDSRRTRFALSRFIVPMAVIVLGAFLLLVKFDLSSVKGQFPVEIAPSHALSWSIAKGVIGQDLLFGYGPENFSLAFDRFGAGQLANTRLSSLRFFDATSQFWTSLAHGGAIAMLGLTVLIWSLVQVITRLGGALSARLGAKDGGSEAMESSGVLSSTVAMTVALFLYPFNMALLGVWFVLLALSALVVSGDRSLSVDIEQRPAFSLVASLGFIIGLILVLATVYFSSVSYLADVAYSRASTRQSPAQALEDIARALSLDNRDDRYYRDASRLTQQVLRQELGRPAAEDPQRPARIQNLIASSVQLAQRATQVQPQEAMNWSNLAGVYQALTGLVDDVERLAEEAYAKAGDLRPGDPQFDNSVGSMWLARADLIRQVGASATGESRTRLAQQRVESLDRAEAAFTRALEQSPTFGSAIYSRAAVYDRQGKVKEAIRDIEVIVPANADNPTLIFELGILYLRDGRNDDAFAAMQRAVFLSPQYANARWYLSLLFEERGDVDSALAQLREIQKSNPDNQVLAAKINQLVVGQQVIPPEEVIDQEPLTE